MKKLFLVAMLFFPVNALKNSDFIFGTYEEYSTLLTLNADSTFETDLIFQYSF